MGSSIGGSMKRLPKSLPFLCLVLSTLLPAGAFAFEGDLHTQQELQKSQPDAIRSVLAHLPGKADLAKATAKFHQRQPPRRTHRVEEALKAFLHHGAAPIRKYLDRR